jgi:uncharacterized protein (TIGR03435 family)
MITRTLFGILLAAMVGSGQTPDGLPKFDAISIRTAGRQVPGRPVAGSEGSAQQGHITWFHRSLASLLVQFFNVAIDQVVMPEWMYDLRTPGTYSYDISVTMPRDTSDQQLQLMVQNLLAERFHLVFHHETRNFPGYELVVADGGSRLKEAEPGVGLGHAASVSTGGGGGGGRVLFHTSGQTMAQFSTELGRMVRESNGEVLGISVPRVADKTGLKGVYPIVLEFRGWTLLPGEALTGAQQASVTPDVARLPDIFGALESHLGLKLVKVADVTLDVLVIDHADSVADGN